MTVHTVSTGKGWVVIGTGVQNIQRRAQVSGIQVQTNGAPRCSEEGPEKGVRHARMMERRECDSMFQDLNFPVNSVAGGYSDWI